MHIRKRIRHYWHNLYYALSPQSGVNFAMKCKDATSMIDLKEIPDSWIGKFRFYFHLSLCQACSNYLKASQALKNAVQNLVSSPTEHVDRLNQELLNKHATKTRD